jgi:hypothetical protein
MAGAIWFPNLGREVSVSGCSEVGDTQGHRGAVFTANEIGIDPAIGRFDDCMVGELAIRLVQSFSGEVEES